MPEPMEYHVEVTNIEDHEDGGATITFDMDDKSQQVMAELGIKFALYCATYGLTNEQAFQAIRFTGETEGFTDE